MCTYKLITFLKTAASKGDSRIELVKLTSSGFKKAKFGKQFEKNIKELFPKLTVEFEQKTDSIVHIYDKSKGPKSSQAARLFRVRGFFDLYCTQGPTTTKGFKAQQKKHPYFRWRHGHNDSEL